MLGMRQELRLQQRLAPQLIQSLHLLQLPALDLEQVVREELETNPLLEEVPAGELEHGKEEPAGETGKEADATSDIDLDATEWSDYLSDSYELSQTFREEPDHSAETYEPVSVYQETLADDLREQLRFVLSDETELKIGEYIIGNLDSNGFLATTVEEIAATLGVPAAQVQKVLKAVQTLDPPGVGARDLRECLLIQLRERGYEEDPAYEIVDKCFDELMHKRTKEIMRITRLSKEDVAEALEVISTLNPKPASVAYGSSERPVTPDLIVERVDGEYVVSLNDRSIPALRISQNYRELLAGGGTEETKKYIVDKLNSAKWLIKSIEQRRTTMLKVMNAIVKHQRAFFDYGLDHLKPMVLQEIADEIKMHVSTVSRVSNGKYVQTPHGVFELKFFFDGKLGVSDGEDMASKVVKEKVKQMIDAEDKQNPLSDQAIADRLTRESGIEIARRTVAKYRDQLRIPSARMRKEV